MNDDPRATGGAQAMEPRPSAVSFITTEHFTLQSARSATIAESTGRANMFLGALSGGLVGLGLVATATRIGTAFFAFALVLLPTLAFVGLVTFERVLQSGAEDHGYARRISRLRAYYFDQAPEITPYLMSVPAAERLHVQGLWSGVWQGFRTVAGMVAVVTGVLAGSTVGLAAAVATNHSLAAALVTGILSAGAALFVLMRYQQSVWSRAGTEPLFPEDTVGPGSPG